MDLDKPSNSESFKVGILFSAMQRRLLASAFGDFPRIPNLSFDLDFKSLRGIRTNWFSVYLSPNSNLLLLHAVAVDQLSTLFITRKPM